MENVTNFRSWRKLKFELFSNIKQKFLAQKNRCKVILKIVLDRWGIRRADTWN